jgi:hypothetical protein
VVFNDRSTGADSIGMASSCISLTLRLTIPWNSYGSTEFFSLECSTNRYAKRAKSGG